MTTSLLQIYQFFHDNPDKWFVPLDVIRTLPQVSRNSVYNTLSKFSTKNPKYLLRRKNADLASEYSFNKDAPKLESRKRGSIANSERIYWTEDERWKLAEEMVRLRKEQPYAPTSELIGKMQNVLPVNRRRDYIKNISLIPWIDSYVDVVTKRAKAAQSKVPEATTTPQDAINKITLEQVVAKPEVKLDITDQIARLDQQQAEREGKDTSLASSTSLKSASLEDLFDEIGQRFAMTIKAAVVGALASEEVQNAIKIKADVNVHHTAEAPKDSVVKQDKRPKIVVLGLRKEHQVHEIETKYGNHLNIVFGQLETPVQTVRNMIQHASELFTVVDNVNYRHANTIRDANLPVKVTRVEGIGQLTYKLTEGYKKYKFM